MQEAVRVADNLVIRGDGDFVPGILLSDDTCDFRVVKNLLTANKRVNSGDYEDWSYGE